MGSLFHLIIYYELIKEVSCAQFTSNQVTSVPRELSCEIVFNKRYVTVI